LGQGIQERRNAVSDIHNHTRTVLLSRLHPLTTHPERWERRFT
jgi:hypothetical protein